jgi:glycosyltransferase involved in cell wall biosynthesis
MMADTTHSSSAPASARAERTSSPDEFLPPAFAINGRFLTQPVTGVQRYAREITERLDRFLHDNQGTAGIYLPAGNEPLPPYQALRAERAKRLTGHLWEQLALPAQDRSYLVNLCNLGPAIRRRQVVCIHDANVFNMPESYSLAFRAVYRTLLPLLARRAAAITTVSRFSAQELARHLPLTAEQITVLPNGHEHVFRWDAGRSTLLSQHRFERPYVFILGSRARHKNIQLILGLAQALDQLGIDIVVTGGKANIFAGDEQSAPAPNVRSMGFVNDDDLAALLTGALCLVFPSFTEGFGLPIVEAMALGCPVISSDRASMPEICGDAALLAPPDQPELWLRQIESLLRSSDLRSELAARGHQRVKSFSWETSARGYLDLVKRAGG